MMDVTHLPLANAGHGSVPELMTTAEVAMIIRASEKTVLRRIKSGKLPAFREGGRWLIKAEDVHAMLIAGMRHVKSDTHDAA